jgi:hypothetical protein
MAKPISNRKLAELRRVTEAAAKNDPIPYLTREFVDDRRDFYYAFSPWMALQLIKELEKYRAEA